MSLITVLPETKFTDYHINDLSLVYNMCDDDCFSTFVQNMSKEFKITALAINKVLNNSGNELVAVNDSDYAIASEIASLERIRNFAKIANDCADKAREDETIRDLLDLMGFYDKSDIEFVCKYAISISTVKLSDGSVLTLERIHKARAKLEYIESIREDNCFDLLYLSDLTVLYDALKCLEKECIF